MTLTLTIGDESYAMTLLEDEAPESVRVFRSLLPLESELMHVRWSGYAVWVNIDDEDLGDVPRENHTVYPSRGDVLLYPGYRNEQEILIACGPTCFKSPAGELAGNHVGMLDATREELAALEVRTLRDGVQKITITE
ncbi:DUF3830 family protein [Haloferax sp. DFSO52]|uniref:DUF3830 family protein n=1 Tax=Haloferax sp. DFSO52 TaxID=3388505 RepID=UPI003A8375BC